jgi:hypothetical protein
MAVSIVSPTGIRVGLVRLHLVIITVVHRLVSSLVALKTLSKAEMKTRMLTHLELGNWSQIYALTTGGGHDDLSSRLPSLLLNLLVW